jgi:hypothetical protein
MEMINEGDMYKFNKMQNSDGTWRFELGGISLIVDGFTVKDNHHLMIHPEKAIAFLNIDGHMYGVANQYDIYKTVEEFFEMMKKQALFFTSKITRPRQNGNSDGLQFSAAS